MSSFDNAPDAQHQRQTIREECWSQIWDVFHKHNIPAEQQDLIMLDLVTQLLFSATSLQRKLALTKEIGLPIDEAIERLRKAEIPSEHFRGVRDL